MSKISDVYEKIKLQQYLLVKTKLEAAIKASREKRELSKEEKEDYKFSDNELELLIDLLQEQGLEEDRDFIRLHESGYIDDPFFKMLTLKTRDGIITILVDDWTKTNKKNIPQIASREELENLLEK